MAKSVTPRCIDCVRDHQKSPGSKEPTWRPAPYGGPRSPRCATHHRARQKDARAAEHASRIQRVYGITGADYDRLKEAQGGVCAICRRATGATRRLSVDHDHVTGSVRGIVCRPCNDLLGHARDDPAFFDRAAQYLRTPPASLFLGTR